MIICTEDDFVEERPFCPKCGGSHVIKGGVKWLCRECGKQWMKAYNPKVVDTTRGGCPYCESRYLVKHGAFRWLCNGCGRTFREGIRLTTC